MKTEKRRVVKNKRKNEDGRKNKRTKSKINISKDTKISTLLEKYPELNEFFFKKGLFCFGCALSSIETLGMICEGYGMDWRKFKKEIEDFLNKK